ncbi:DEAD-box ATP-dependent RNA helicase 16 [Chlorella vulgaris]
MSFDDTGLDPRLLRALSKRGLTKPTPVQAECIPKALEGRDVVARAPTGSGKTLAYLLPALHRVLAADKGKAGWQALVLVPTRELCEQVREEAASVASLCGSELTVSAVAGDTPLRALCATAGQLVVTTPAKLAQALREGILTPRVLQERLQVLVLDEADLLLSYGYEEDVQALAPHVPRSAQCLLMSATSSADVDRLTKLVLHNPAALNLLGQSTAKGEEAGVVAGGAAAEIEHFSVGMPAGCKAGGAATETVERLLHLLALLKLNLVQRKVLVFVNSADSGMRVRLFLEAFGIRAAVLSADQPLNSRHHILQEFNRGLFDYLIATDDIHGGNGDDAEDEGRSKRQRKGSGGGGGGKRQRKDEEFGVTRGIDFKGVRTVVNFEAPSSTQGYVHRVGRTGRAGESGTAISLLAPSDAAFAAELAAMLRSGGEGQQAAAAAGPAAAAAAAAGAAESESEEEEEERRRAGGAAAGLQPHSRLTSMAVEGLRYRAEDVARSITRNVIREARAKELKNELLNSQRLAAFFEEHPGDLNLLKHDKPLAATGAAAAAAHLKHIPAYLRDPSLQGKSFAGNSGRGVLPARKRRKTEGLDPVKGGFVRAPRKGGEANEEPTELEKSAEQWGKKHRPKKVMGKGDQFKPKQNVRKGRGRKR